MIVKVQRSLTPRDRAALIYNKSKKIYYETYDPKEMTYVRSRLGNAMKGYFRAKIEANGKLTLMAQVEKQDW